MMMGYTRGLRIYISVISSRYAVTSHTKNLFFYSFFFTLLLSSLIFPYLHCILPLPFPYLPLSFLIFTLSFLPLSSFIFLLFYFLFSPHWFLKNMKSRVSELIYLSNEGCYKHCTEYFFCAYVFTPF